MGCNNLDQKWPGESEFGAPSHGVGHVVSTTWLSFVSCLTGNILQNIQSGHSFSWDKQRRSAIYCNATTTFLQPLLPGKSKHTCRNTYSLQSIKIIARDIKPTEKGKFLVKALRDPHLVIFSAVHFFRMSCGFFWIHGSNYLVSGISCVHLLSSLLLI